MTNFNSTDDKFYQGYLQRNGDFGVAQLEIANKELEVTESYEHCLYLKTQIENYYNKKNNYGEIRINHT